MKTCPLDKLSGPITEVMTFVTIQNIHRELKYGEITLSHKYFAIFACIVDKRNYTHRVLKMLKYKIHIYVSYLQDKYIN